MDYFMPSAEEIGKAMYDIQRNGIELGAGDYVDIESLKIAYRVMEHYLEELIGE